MNANSTPVDEDMRDALLAALRMNWDHARHVETQRIALNLAYVGAMGAGVSFVFGEKAKLIPSLLVVAAALFLTVLSWAMTRKWNLAFSVQIQRADRCARTLLLSVPPSADCRAQFELHSFVGFPTRDPKLPRMNIRALFAALHIGSLVMWLLIAAYIIGTCTCDA